MCTNEVCLFCLNNSGLDIPGYNDNKLRMRLFAINEKTKKQKNKQKNKNKKRTTKKKKKQKKKTKTQQQQQNKQTKLVQHKVNDGLGERRINNNSDPVSDNATALLATSLLSVTAMCLFPSQTVTKLSVTHQSFNQTIWIYVATRYN